MSEIMDWLNGHDMQFQCLHGNHYVNLIRVPVSDTIEYIYSQANFNNSVLKREKFEYAGIYNRDDGLVYDANYDLRGCGLLLANEYDRSHDLGSVYKVFEDQVNARIKEVIGDDRSNLHITEAEIEDEYWLRMLNEAKTCHQRNRVRALVLEGVEVHFEPWFRADDIHSDLIIDILEKHDALVNETASKWIKENREKSLIQFISNDMLKADLDAIYANPQHPLFLIKKIMAAVAGGYKTVNVTTMIDGKKLTFKTDACVLQRDPDGAYYTFRMAAPDRKKFEDFYGPNRDYLPQEIVKISYGKKVLYQKKEEKTT